MPDSVNQEHLGWQGSSVASGGALAVVVATGSDTPRPHLGGSRGSAGRQPALGMAVLPIAYYLLLVTVAVMYSSAIRVLSRRRDWNKDCRQPSERRRLASTAMRWESEGSRRVLPF